jgi:anti-sigma B factor antagonist
MTPLSIARQRKDGVVVLRLEGHLTLGPAASTLSEAMTEALAGNGVTGIVVNMAKVERMDSAGMGELVIAASRAGEKRAKLALCAVTPRLRDLLKITRLDGVLDIYADEAAAVAGVSGAERS